MLGSLATAGLPSTLVLGAQASPAAASVAESTAFGSGFGYIMMLPPGWSVTAAAGEPAGGEDLFEGPDGMTVRVGGGPADPSHTLEDRVAANREEVTADGTCESDPTADVPSTLGNEEAIAWSWRCADSYHAAVNTLHDGLRLRLQVNVPIDLEPEAAALLESFRSGFQFVDPDDPAPARADLAALEGVLEGSYETPWHPVELELAAVEAAGLQRPGDPPWEEWIAAADTVRQVVRFENGVMTNYCAIDSRPLEICWESQYRLLDDHTIEANEGTYRSVYEFTLRDGILTLDLVDSSHPLDWAPLTATFETLPFTRIP